MLRANLVFGLVVLVAASCDFPRLPRLVGDGAAELDARLEDAALAPAPDAALGDALLADSTGGSATDCFQQWMDGTLTFTNLRQISELSSGSSSAERDPWISEDGLRLYFARTSGTSGGVDIFLATRASQTASFGTPMDLVNLNGSGDDDRPALSGDELTIVFARDPNSGGNARVQLARRDQRSDMFPSPDSDSEALVQAVNMDSADHFNPFLSRDGLRLYLAPRASGRQQIMVATRLSTDAAFSMPAPVRGVDRSGPDEFDPAVSADERIIVFSSTDSTVGTDLWYATRPVSSGDFAAPALIPQLNSSGDDGDPMLSADGCELYFSSTRGGSRHIWHADVVR